MPMFRRFLSIALLSSSFTLGCGSSEPADTTTPTVVTAPSPVVKSSSEDPYDLCVAT